jgi:hypothetical protein
VNILLLGTVYGGAMAGSYLLTKEPGNALAMMAMISFVVLGYRVTRE